MGIQRVVAAIVANVADDFADEGALGALDGEIRARFGGLQHAVIVADAHVGGGFAKIFSHARAAAVFDARERNFLAAQRRNSRKDINVFADQFGNGVGVIAAG